MKNRLNLSAIKLKELDVNLIESQIMSFEQLLESGLQELFQEINPIDDYTGESWQLEFGDLRLGDPKYTAQKAQRLGLSYDAPLFVNTKLTNKKTGEIQTQELFVADLPIMSRRGTFVVNGNERVTVSQLVRAEGVLFVESKNKSRTRKLYSIKLMPSRGRWMDFEVNRYGVMSVKLINKRQKVLLTTLLRALGYSTDEQIKKILSRFDTDEDFPMVEATLKADTTRNTEDALIDIYSKLRPEDSINLESAQEFLDSIFFNARRFFLGKIGRYQLNRKLDLNSDISPENYTLNREDVVAIIQSVVKINAGHLKVEDVDHLSNRRVRGAGELIGDKIREGLLRMEKNIKDRMGTYGANDQVTPSLLVNTRPVIASVNQFFGSSSLSRYMDQENVLSEMETKRRITAGGQGGLTKESATFSVRDVHNSHYSRLCPVSTPEGPMIGIVGSMSVYARINEYGFLEAPYRKVVGTITSVDKSAVKKEITANVVDENGKTLYKKGSKVTEAMMKKVAGLDNVSIKVAPYVTDEIVYLDAKEEIDYKLGPASVSIDDDGNILDQNVFVRSNNSFMNVLADEIDFIDVNPGQISGLGLTLIPYAQHDDPTRTLMGSNMQRQAVPLIAPKSPVVGTGYEKIVAKSSGRAIYAEEDGVVTAVDGGEVEVKYKKIGKKHYSLDKFVRTNQNTAFTQTPVVKLGQKIKKDDLLANGPAMENGELALGQNILTAYMIFDGFNYDDGIVVSERLVKDDVLTSVHIYEYVIDIRETKLGNEELTVDIPNVGTHALRNLDESGIVRVGARVEPLDILVGVIAPKGETELTAEEKLLRAIFGEFARDVRDNSLRLPHGDKGIVTDVQILSKEKGDKLNPGVIKQVKVWVARTHKIGVGDKLTGRHGDKGVITKVLPVEDMPYLEDGTPVDIVLSPLFIKRMNLGQLMETYTGKIAQQLDLKVEIPSFAPIDEDILLSLARKNNVDLDQKSTLYDGRTGKAFSDKVLVGPRYILKLNHLADSKVHSRSTGPYTMVTQQPLGGKAQFGGQRFGEMEVWALEAHTVPEVLHEMLTIKSDDVVGRANAYKSIIQGTTVEAPTTTESFKVLIAELRSLGLNIDLIEPERKEEMQIEDAVEEKELEENQETAEEITKDMT